MPYLGFDPSPGDVGTVQYLARQHHALAEEVRQAGRYVAAVDLTSWQGQASTVAVLLRDSLVNALNGVAGAAHTLAEACSAWVRQLALYQGEADTLERQARTATEEHAYLLRRQSALRLGGSSATFGELDVAQTQLQRIQRRARQLHQDYERSAAKLAAQLDERKSMWERTEPVRKVLEGFIAPLDMVAIDHWIDRGKDISGIPAERVRELGKLIKQIEKTGDLSARSQRLLEAGQMAETYGESISAWERWAPSWLQALYPLSNGAGKVMDGLGIIADAGTVISPQDSGALGAADRTAAGINGVLLAADLVSIDLGPVGAAVIVATGAYLAADYFYHHWKPFHDVANDIGHGAVKVNDFLTGRNYSADLAIAHAASRVGESVANAAEDTVHAVAGEVHHVTWHSVVSTVESWF
jgi:hypothetical protein